MAFSQTITSYCRWIVGGEDDSEYEYVEAVPEENSPLEHVDKAAMLLERANIEYN